MVHIRKTRLESLGVLYLISNTAHCMVRLSSKICRRGCMWKVQKEEGLPVLERAQSNPQQSGGIIPVLGKRWQTIKRPCASSSATINESLGVAEYQLSVPCSNHHLFTQFIEW